MVERLHPAMSAGSHRVRELKPVQMPVVGLTSEINAIVGSHVDLRDAGKRSYRTLPRHSPPSFPVDANGSGFKSAAVLLYGTHGSDLLCATGIPHLRWGSCFARRLRRSEVVVARPIWRQDLGELSTQRLTEKNPDIDGRM